MVEWKVQSIEWTRDQFPEVRAVVYKAWQADSRGDDLTHLTEQLSVKSRADEEYAWKTRYWDAYRATMGGVLKQMQTLAIGVLKRPMTPEELRDIEVDIHSWFGLDAEGREVE